MRIVLPLVILLALPMSAAAQNLLISEIMQNPRDVNDSAGEWFEVFNPTTAAIDLEGWTIRDDDSDSHVITASVVVPAGGFAVLCRNADPGTNGGLTCDYEYASFQLANGADEVILEDPSGTEVDRVAYDGGSLWPDPNGASMVFNGQPTDDNNDPAFWVEALERQATYTGAGTDLGSPGSAGSLQSALPVELTAFEATLHEGTVRLSWTTASELNNAGFEVQHSVDNMTFAPLGFVEGHGTTTLRQHYDYPVSGLPPGRHVFRLKQVDYDGTFAYSPTVEVTLDLAGTFHLSEAYPNPFNPSTRFTVTVPTRQHVVVAVYSLLGRRVRVLFDGVLEAQVPQTITFEAGDLPSGVYLYRATGTSFSATRPVTLLK
ncbi:hypothetical protein AWN76_006655 [Rhodothermaceae bacterium RA]|nr:hypothetical protein AWN76_006655 [Rhodothermaceae bacterium RA]